MKGKTSYLEIRPKAALYEKDQFVPLDQPTPFDVASKRQDLSITIEKMTVKGNNVVVDFQFNHGDSHKKDISFFKSFAMSDVTLVKKSEKSLYKKPMKHTVTVLDKDQLRFRSTSRAPTFFRFNPDKYVVRVNLGEIGANMPIELDPITIHLNK